MAYTVGVKVESNGWNKMDSGGECLGNEAAVGTFKIVIEASLHTEIRAMQAGLSMEDILLCPHSSLILACFVCSSATTLEK